LNQKSFPNVTVRRHTVELGLLLEITGPQSEVFAFIGEQITDKQQIVMDGPSREAKADPIIHVVALDDDYTGKLDDAKAALPKQLLQGLQREDVDYSNLAFDSGDGVCLNNAEAGMARNPNGKLYAVGKFFAVFDDQGCVKGDANKSRTLLTYGRDIERCTIAAGKFGDERKIIAFGQEFGGKVRNAIVDGNIIEAELGGTRIAVLTPFNLRKMFGGTKQLDATTIDLKDALGGGTIEDITLEVGKGMFLATIQDDSKRFLPIVLINEGDHARLTPVIKQAVNVDDIKDFDVHGGMVRFGMMGATFVDRNGGESAITFRGLKTLPKGLQKLAEQYAA